MKFYSRLTKKEEEKNWRKAIFFSFLSLSLIIGFIFLGIPILGKVAILIGNLKSSSSPIEKEDIIPPAAPIISSIPEATFSGQIKISGFAEPGANVEIFVGDISQGKIIAENDGTFNFPNLQLVEGKNEIYALATDKSGNISQPSPKIVIFLDQKPPKIKILSPQNNTSFWGSNKRIEIKGETDTDATVMINDHLAVMEAEGKFSYFLTLEPGENKIKIIATDKAGNQAEEELTLFLE